MKISVKVVPQSKLNKVEKISDHSFKVWTSASATDNKANKAVIELLADFFKIRKSQVYLIAGLTSKEKIVEIL